MKTLALALLVATLFVAATYAEGVVLQPVESSLISQAGYDPATQMMAVKLVENSDLYFYKGVPQEIYDGFVAAESKGAYFVENIKGKFDEDLAK